MKPDLTHGRAVGWALGVTLAFMIAAQQVSLLAPRIAHDLVLLVGIEVVVYLAACALFAARRPGRSFEDLFAFRRAPVPLLVAAGALGFGLRAPADFVEEAIQKLAPMPKPVHDEMAALLVPHSTAHAIVLALVVGLAGPFGEELFYRGALFTGLRSSAVPASAAITTSLRCTSIHPEPRFWLPVLLLAGGLGFLRALSGSLWPGVLLHGTFNGTAVVMAFSGGKADELELKPAVVVGSAVVSVLLLLVLARLGRGSAITERARALDVRPMSEPGAPS